MRAGRVHEWIEKVVSYDSTYPDRDESPPPRIPFVAVNKHKRQREDDTEKHQRLKASYPTPEIESFSTGSPEISFQEEGSHYQLRRKRHRREVGHRAHMADSAATIPSLLPDTDQTPRATRLTESSRPYSASQSSSSVASSDRSSTKRSRRSGNSSPSKRAVLRTLQSGIDFRILRGTSAVPAVDVLNIGTLIDRVRGFEANEAVVPECEKDALRQHQYDERNLRHDHVYYDIDHARARLGGAPLKADVEYMVAKALQCSELGESKAAWNCYVHAPLLMQAEKLSRHQQRVTTMNITTAKIGPSNLLPTGQDDTTIESRMVDFAIVLQASKNLTSKLSHLYSSVPGAARSYNHTLYNPIIDRPIAVSIETKREADNFETGLFQPGTWTSAQFARLAELLQAAAHGNTTLPALPILLVQGPFWHFCLASRAIDGGTTIWHSIIIGDARNRLGVYAIVSLLLLLMDWTETEFRPWFETNVVPP